jgi:glycosyltransferase involved in cell wall biosynthesis
VGEPDVPRGLVGDPAGDAAAVTAPDAARQFGDWSGPGPRGAARVVGPVAIVTRFFRPYPAAGGAEIQADRLCRFLVAQGAGCEIVTTRFRSDLPSRELETDVRVRRLGTPRSALGGRPTEFLIAFWWFVLNGHRFPIVHALCLSAFTLGAMIGARVRGSHVIVMPCTVGPAGDVARATKGIGGGLIWRFFSRADVMLAETAAGAAELEARGIARRKIVRLPAFLGDAFRPPTDNRERTFVRTAIGLPQRPIVLFVGRLVETKGVRELLEAWLEVAVRHRATLVLIGDGPMRPLAESVAESLEDRDAIRVLGQIEDPTLYYRAADVFVFPSHSEAFGRALAEAMATGLAVITTRTGLAADVIDDGHDALIVPIRDPIALAEAISQLVDDESRRRTLGSRAHRRAQEAFAPQEVGKAILDLHWRLVHAKGYRQP